MTKPAISSVEAEAQVIVGRMPASANVWLRERLATGAQSLRLDASEVLAQLVAFDQERLDKPPAAAEYPDAQPWVDYALSLDRQLASMGLTQQQRAIWRSGDMFFSCRAPDLTSKRQNPERCRVAYIPESDVGAFHIKNIDDPTTHWKPSLDPPDVSPYLLPLVWDGTGSGLHIDEEPGELFPLPVYRMCMALCEDVPAAVELLTRYGLFWGGANCVLHDRQKRSVAIEKCSYTRISVYPADTNGVSYCSGMACRDPNSESGRQMSRMRQKYEELMGLPSDSSDRAYWNYGQAMERNLSDFLTKPESRQSESLTRFFLTPTPDGLRKDGDRVHADQAELDYTLATRAIEIDRGRFLRWQRSTSGDYPRKPEVAQQQAG